MPFDANLVLIDGSVSLIPGTDGAAVSETRDAVTGGAVIDLKDGNNAYLRTNASSGWSAEGAIHMCAVLSLPSAPSTYADTLVVTIQQSDYFSYGFNDIAVFPTLYAFNRLLKVITTTAFVAGDLDTTLTGSITGDSAVMRWFSPNLIGAVGNAGYILGAMEGADDLFDNATEDFTTSGTGAGTLTQVGAVPAKPMLGGPNSFVRAFSITKRYIRAEATVSTGGDFGAVQVLLSPYPFKRL